MHELAPLVALAAYAYAAALMGLILALLMRHGAVRRGCVPTPAEATWNAFLPPLAVLLLPLFLLLEPHALGPLTIVHDLWHRLERSAHSIPVAHGGLHLGNTLLLLLALVSGVRTVYLLARVYALGTDLRRVARPLSSAIGEAPVLCVPAPRPACFAAGTLRTAVYVTTGLLDSLSLREQEAVMAHETAHLRYGDPLRRSLLLAFYTLFSLPGSRLLLWDWSRAVERRADAEAARRIGNAADVAGALVHVARLTTRPSAPEPHLAAFAGEHDDIEGRVEALLAAPGEVTRPDYLRRVLLPGTSLALLFFATCWLHHAVEFFIRH